MCTGQSLAGDVTKDPVRALHADSSRLLAIDTASRVNSGRADTHRTLMICKGHSGNTVKRTC